MRAHSRPAASVPPPPNARAHITKRSRIRGERFENTAPHRAPIAIVTNNHGDEAIHPQNAPEIVIASTISMRWRLVHGAMAGSPARSTGSTVPKPCPELLEVVVMAPPLAHRRIRL